MTLIQVLGYAAALLLVASFAMKTIIWLRYLAIASNLALLAYGALAANYAVLVLSVLMLAANAYRLVEMRRLVDAARAATGGAGAPVSVDWLLPYMRPLDLPKDHVLFRKGDRANAMYFIADGRVAIEEFGLEIEKGNLFGEMGVLSVDNVRTASARCVEPCALMEISAEKVRELYYQNPEFGFFLVGMITKRLTDDLARVTRPTA